jgi:hypothetical protein
MCNEKIEHLVYSKEEIMAAVERERVRSDEHTADTRSEDLRDSPMMAHLLDALEEGTDIGHYGRLTFAMIARHFMDEDELVRLLADQRFRSVTIIPQSASASWNGRRSRSSRSVRPRMTHRAVTSIASCASRTESMTISTTFISNRRIKTIRYSSWPAFC